MLMAGTMALCGEAMESTPLEGTVAPDASARAMISDALPRMTVGFNLSSREQVVLWKLVAPTPTGSKTTGNWLRWPIEWLFPWCLPIQVLECRC